MTRIASGGLELAVDDAGSASSMPAVLLVHGFPDTHRLWRHQIPALTAAGYRTLAPDLPGCGASDKPTDVRRYAIPRLVEDMVAVLDAAGVDRVHLVGHDWGAAVAWPLAALHPERVATLTVISVGHPTAFASSGLAQLRRSWYTQLFQVRGLAEWILARQPWSDHPEPDEVKARLNDRTSLAAALAPYRANMGPKVVFGRIRGQGPTLPRIQSPTMGIWSTRDKYLTEPVMLRSEQYVDGGWRYERIDGVGHWIPLEAPDRLNTLLLDFLPQP